MIPLLANLFLFEVVFLVAYRYAMTLVPASGAPLWMPDSVLLCALLLSRRRTWFLFIAATLPIRLTVAVPAAPLWFLLVCFVNDSLKAMLVAGLLRRFLPGRGVRFDSLPDFWIYVASAVAAVPALSAVAGAAVWLLLGRPFWIASRDWFLGDALANLVLTPLLLYLAQDWRKVLRAGPLRYVEALAIFSGLFLAIQFAYRRGPDYPGVLGFHNYIPVAFLLLAAVRFGPPGASAALSAMSMLWIAAAGVGRPPAQILDGTATILAIQLFLLVTGIPIMSLAVLIEQQRRTEYSLRESETRFRVMADTAPVMIWISGPDKLATFFNRGWLDFTGRAIGDELGFGWISGLHPDFRAVCLAAYSSAFADRSRWHMECQLRRADGEYRWVLYGGTPRFGVDGGFEGYIVAASDITDLKMAQEASVARQKLESLGMLAGGVAHDFNNLLGGIHANAEIAESAGAAPDEQIQNIKHISMRAAGIVRQLMIYAGGDPSEMEPLDVSRLVGEMLDLIHVSISKSAVLTTDLAPGLPAVLGNAAQLQQVVMNLVLNASDAVAGGTGCIQVATSATSRGTEQYVELEVSDNGSGITKETQPRIFDPFFTTKPTGRGLGLAVVQGVVRAHQGTIELTSTPRQGTTFRVLLPTAKLPAARPSANPSPRLAPRDMRLRPATVLVVEDEEVLRVCVAKMLSKRGYTVLQVGDGTSAIKLIADLRIPIDAVLLDLTIPGASSNTVMAEAGRLRPNLKFLLTSAYSRETIGPTAAQVRGFIRKPFQLRELADVIETTLSL